MIKGYEEISRHASVLEYVDWANIIFQVRRAKRWRNGDIARHLVKECGMDSYVVHLVSAELGRLQQRKLRVPRVTLAIKLFDLYEQVVVFQPMDRIKGK